MFAGMITGILFAGLVGLVASRVNQRRNPEAEDERMAMVKAQAGSTALRIAGGVAFIGWVADNLLAYSRGEAIQTITPWSIMLLAIVAIYDLSLAYFLHQYSADGGEEVTKKDVASTALTAAATLLVFIPMIAHGEFRGDRGLYYVMIGTIVLQVAAVLWLLFKARRSFRSAGGGHA